MLHGLRDSDLTTADVADGREPAIQRVRQHSGAVLSHVRQRLRLDLCDLYARAQHMAVGIDEAGHECAAPDVQDFSRIRGWKLPADLGDAIALDDDHGFLEILGLRSIEYACIDR